MGYGDVMKVTLRQLQVFDSVAAMGSVTAAAASLGMSQSAASLALADLQIILKRQLFAHSKGRPLQITDEGKRLRPIVRSLLSEILDIERSGAQAELSGTLVIGATLMIAETVLPKFCTEFMKLHSAVRVRVEIASVDELYRRLCRYELETALIEGFPDLEGIEMVPWWSDEWVLVVAPDHPLAQRGPLRLCDLAEARWCTREAQSGISARLRYLLQDHIVRLDVAFESPSNWAVRHAVITGGGIGCLPHPLVKFDLQVGRLVQLDVPEFRCASALSLARPHNIWRSQLVREFDTFLLANGNATGS